MTTNPNLLFALESTATNPLSTSITTTVATPLGPHRAREQAKDPRHGCINGIKISTCKMCAGHVLRSKAACTACKGTGFSGARCTACAVGAVFALRTLIKEVAADIRAEDNKKAKDLEKQALATRETSQKTETREAKDSKAEETKDENDTEEEGETSEE
ncbi:hypothetical protein E4T48_04907 [Aureobasidium sp. EXF-10727]|nr:hypothetical protein E4T48_04907 [Aureobasidium sp. EXF-10727]